MELRVEGKRYGEMEPIVKAIIDQEKPAHTFYRLRRGGKLTNERGLYDEEALEEELDKADEDLDEPD